MGSCFLGLTIHDLDLITQSIRRLGANQLWVHQCFSTIKTTTVNYNYASETSRVVHEHQKDPTMGALSE
jgi:hypothetical protein